MAFSTLYSIRQLLQDCVIPDWALKSYWPERAPASIVFWEIFSTGASLHFPATCFSLHMDGAELHRPNLPWHMRGCGGLHLAERTFGLLGRERGTVDSVVLPLHVYILFIPTFYWRDLHPTCAIVPPISCNSCLDKKRWLLGMGGRLGHRTCYSGYAEDFPSRAADGGLSIVLPGLEHVHCFN